MTRESVITTLTEIQAALDNRDYKLATQLHAELHQDFVDYCAKLKKGAARELAQLVQLSDDLAPGQEPIAWSLM